MFGRNLQCQPVRKWTPERNANGHTHTRASSVGAKACSSMASSSGIFLSKTRTVHPAISLPDRADGGPIPLQWSVCLCLMIGLGFRLKLGLGVMADRTQRGPTTPLRWYLREKMTSSVHGSNTPTSGGTCVRRCHRRLHPTQHPTQTNCSDKANAVPTGSTPSILLHISAAETG
jgi:hypothetical protein